MLGATVLHPSTVSAALTATSTIDVTTPEDSIDSKNHSISSPLSSRSDTALSSLPTPSLYNDFPERSEARVLIAGCGNSILPFDMIEAGWIGGIVGIDFSCHVINQMKSKAFKSKTVLETAAAESKQPEEILDYNCTDVTQSLPEYSDGSFDLILVKGTFDAILCSNGSRSNIVKMIKNFVRLLSSGHGVLFIVTTGNPDNRLEYLEYQNELTHYWRNVSVHPLRNSAQVVGASQPS
jgi:SAM-dependent methyltransferase